jgi:Zn-dependent M28 family amino/carboxypeptidase
MARSKGRHRQIAAAAAALALASGGLFASANTDPDLGAALHAIDGADLLRHIQELSSDEFEGRAPGTQGEVRTITYLEQQFRALGLEPGNPDNSYTQTVPMTGYTAMPQASYTTHGKSVSLKYPDDFVAYAPQRVSPVRIEASQLVFVGYGIQAPEYAWDDYKGRDLKGKTLVMLINDPPLPDPSDPHKLDDKMFGGRALTYYGRWTYKYEMAAKLGAAAAIIVHETVPATYPWSVVANGAKGENFELKSEQPSDKYPEVAAWMTRQQAESLFAASGQDFAALKRAALSRDFKPVDLGATISFNVGNKWRDVTSHNFVAKLQGSDPVLQHQYVVYTAHWDHFGWDPTLPGDKHQQIYHGARDNASGVAALLVLARAFKALPHAPKRTIIFMATTGEESGLLGSGYYSRHPLYPLRNTLADINVDEMPTRGRTRDIELVTSGKSSLDEIVRDQAAKMDLEVRDNQQPELGSFYRADHLEFARVGVPVAYLEAGKEVIGKPAGYGKKQEVAYNDHDYHQVTDTVKPDWDLGGATQDLQLLLRVGYAVADGRDYPHWYPTSEFRAAREAMLAQPENSK